MAIEKEVIESKFREAQTETKKILDSCKENPAGLDKASYAEILKCLKSIYIYSEKDQEATDNYLSLFYETYQNQEFSAKTRLYCLVLASNFIKLHSLKEERDYYYQNAPQGVQATLDHLITPAAAKKPTASSPFFDAQHKAKPEASLPIFSSTALSLNA